MHRGRLIALAAAGAVALSACAASVDVTTERADPIQVPTVEATPTTTALPDDPAPLDPGQAAPPPPMPTPTSGDVDPEAINFGTNKPPRAYDDFLLAVMTDL